jgi:RHS repeat-associated protein
MIDSVIAQGGGNKVKFAIIPHAASASIQDMDLTTPGIQIYTTATADSNGNGIADIREILHSYTPAGSNNFTTALTQIDNLFTALTGDPNLIFLSDGYGRLDPVVATAVVADIKAKGGNVSAFGIGEASTIDTLQKIDPTAIRITDFQQLVKIFSGFDDNYAIEPLKQNVTVYLDANNNGQLDLGEANQITRPNPTVAGLIDTAYNYSFNNLLPGNYTIRTLVPNGYALTTPAAITDTITVNGGEFIHLTGIGKITPPVNIDPVFITTAPVGTKLNAGGVFTYRSNAVDNNADPLTYSLINAPTGMTVDPTSGVVVWNPTLTQVENYYQELAAEQARLTAIGRGAYARTKVEFDTYLRVSDGTLTTQQTYALTVGNIPINHSPEITSTPTFTTNLDKTYSYQLTGKDLDNDTLIWSLDNAPKGMVIDSSTGIVKWNPTSTQLGTHTVAVRLTDAYGAYVGQEYTLKVNGVNTPPQIQSSPNTVGGLNSPYKYQVKAVDLEGDTLTYTLGRRPTGMIVQGDTGLITWTPNATQIIDVLVTDIQGAVSTQTYNLVVGSTPINQAPTITSTPKLTADINTKYQYQVVANDPENNQITYALATAPTGMVIDASTGLITWNSPTLGKTNIKITATDTSAPLSAGTSGAVAVQEYTLTGNQNHAPVINSTPITQVTIGNTYRYDVVATDSDNDALTYALDNASKLAGVSIDKLGRITWKPTTANLGIKPVTVTVADAIGAVVTQTYNLEVLADNTAPVVNLVRGTNIADIGETISFQVQATDNVGIKSTQLLINNQAVALDSNGVGTYKVTTVGIVTATATVTDVNGNVSTANSTTNVIDPTDIEAPNINLDLSGIIDGIITGRTDIKGTVTDTNLDYYTLEVARWGTDNWQEVFRGTTSVTNGSLGKFDPSLLENDSYRVRLTAFDTGGHGSQVEDQIDVTGDLKLGNFRLSFTDLTVPVTGIPITLTRTYDSLTSGTTDDFGYGWRMEFRDTDLRTSLKKDDVYEQLDYRTVGFNFGTRIYITLPGGKREGFTFQPKQVQGDLGGVTGGRLFYPSFVSDQGVTSTLTVPNAEVKANTDKNSNNAGDFSGNANGVLLYKEGKLFNLAGRPYVPQDDGFGNRYILTTKDGTKYEINATTGDLESVTDTNGNVLTYSDTEIKSSTGVKVTFERDNQGRITSVTDPLGAKVQYGYDVKGDLVSVKDRDGNETKFEYNATRSHYLDKIVDSLGREAVKTEYDEAGRLKKTANSSGNGVEFVYNPNNSLETVKDALGNATTYEYDKQGNVVTEVDALGGIIRRTYDDDTNMLSETDAEGRKTTYTYDSQKNQLSRTDGNGKTYYYTYGANGKLTSSVDPLGNTTKYVLDGKGNVLTETNADGKITTYTYDGSGNNTSITNALGKTTAYQYDGRGNLTQETDALGHITKYTYDGRGNKLTETKTVTTPTGSRTLVSSQTYDGNGNVISVLDAEGNSTQYEYNKAGKQTLVIDANGKKTIARYDDNNRLVETIFDDGLSNQFTYDANGKKTQSIDRDGHTTTFKYDALGRSTELISPDATPNTLADNPRKRMEYDKAGWLTAIIDEQGNRQEWTYDGARNLTGNRTSIGTTPASTTSTYDAAGRQTSTTDALKHTTLYVYDSLGRLVETRYADGLTSKTVYDAIGKEIVKIDRANRQTKYEYDALGHLITVIDPINATTAYNYDELGDLVLEIDANGHQTKYEYDGIQRRTAVIRPLGQRATTSYNPVGTIASTTDFNGQTTNYTYDRLGLLVDKKLADGSQTSVTYTPTGKRKTVTDDRGTITYSYNAGGQVASVLNPDGQQLNYNYDPQGHLTQIVTAAGTTGYSYGALNRLEKVTDNQGGITTYTYDVMGNLVTTQLANGIVETRGYDSLNRLVSLTNTNAQSVLISGYTYTLDAVGNKIKVVENNGRKVDYTYDSRARLLSEQITDAVNGNRTTSYTYDAVGNRLTVADSVAGATSYTYNNNDWLVTETQGTELTQYTYDNNGSLLSKFHNANDKVAYTWNLDRRLAGVQTTDSSGTHQSTYTYDADGNRVRQTVDGVSTNYLVDTNRSLAQVAAEYDSSGVKASYTYAGGVISQSSNNVRTFYVNDGHSGVRLITNNTGAVTDAYNYDGYGNLLQSVGNASGERYRGEASDAATGLQYLRARYYDPSTGRFLSTDAFEGVLESPVSRHRYLYGNANPITYADPSGNFSMAEAVSSITINDILIGLGTSAFLAQSIIALKSNQDIEWEGKFVVEAKASLAKYNPFKLDGYYLDAKSECSFNPSSGTTGSFHGYWVILTAGISLVPTDENATFSIPIEVKLNSDIKLFSPGFVGTNLLTFFGEVSSGKVKGPGGGVSGFTIGFGRGYSLKSNDPTLLDPYISFNGFAGISIPVGGAPEVC